MAYPKFKPLVDDTITLMGQVAGSGVQTYSEPLVKMALNNIFDYLWNKRKWEHLWQWTTNNVGPDGRLTADIPGLRDYADLGQIRDANNRKTIPRPVTTEHLWVTGSSILYYEILPWNDPQADTRFFSFFPVGATGPVEIYAGIRPEQFVGDDDIVPMDYNLMVFGATWFMLADDGTNPASADKYQGLFDLTYQNIVARINAQEIGQGPGRHNGQTVYIR